MSGRKTFIRYLRRSFAFNIVLLFIVSAIALVTILEAHQKASWVHHTQQVIDQLETLISSMKDGETGVRGFMVTRDAATLQPYRGAYHRTIIAFNQVKSLTRDNERQQRDIPGLYSSITSVYQHLNTQVGQASIGQPATTQSILHGKELMDHARLMVNNMQSRERDLLTERTNGWKFFSAIAPYLIMLLFFMAVYVAYFYCKRLKITFYKKLKLQRDLQRINIETKQRITAIKQLAGEIASGNYATRFTEDQKDVLGELSGHLNRMAEALELSFDHLNEVMKKKDDFISIASHEIKTPLTSIQAYLQLIEKRLPSLPLPKIQEFVAKAVQQTNKLSNIVKSLLESSKITAGHLELHLEQFAVNKFIQQTVDESLSIKDGHNVIIHADGDITVTADRFRLTQVLTNLITNAFKYSPAGSTVTITAIADQHVATITVADEGIGIPADKLPYIFERYYRVEQSSQNYSGVGLGLYISRQIIERHGGKITATSKPGEGTRISFTLPANAN